MNDKLRICPRCESLVCEHVERRVANALCRIGTGVLNVDLVRRYTWLASLQKRGPYWGRTAFIELKRAGESPASAGLRNTYRDITGELTTGAGVRLEQRGFLLREGEPWVLSTFVGVRLVDLPCTLDDAAEHIETWMKTGELPGGVELSA